MRVDLVVLLGHELVRGRANAGTPVGGKLEPHRRLLHRRLDHHFDFLGDDLLDDLFALHDLRDDAIDRYLDLLGHDLFLRDDTLDRDFLNLGPGHDRLDGNFLDDRRLDRDFLRDDLRLSFATGRQGRDASRAYTQSTGNA